MREVYKTLISTIFILGVIILCVITGIRSDIRGIQTQQKMDTIVKVLNQQIEVDRELLSQIKAPDNKLKAFNLIRIENPNDIKVINMTCNLLSDEDSYDCQGQFLFKNANKLSFPIPIKRNRATDKE